VSPLFDLEIDVENQLGKTMASGAAVPSLASHD
jgi:hypothetical protein